MGKSNASLFFSTSYDVDKEEPNNGLRWSSWETTWVSMKNKWKCVSIKTIVSILLLESPWVVYYYHFIRWTILINLQGLWLNWHFLRSLSIKSIKFLLLIWMNTSKCLTSHVLAWKSNFFYPKIDVWNAKKLCFLFIFWIGGGGTGYIKIIWIHYHHIKIVKSKSFF